MNRLLPLLICLCTFNLHAQTVGWFYGYPGSADGYFLFTPSNSSKTFLLDKCGKQIHEWVSFYDPGMAVYLLEDGTLLRCGDTNNNQFQGGGQGGILEKYDWDGFLLWSYKISDSEQCQHHDAIQLPNGNVVAIVWEYHTKADAQANGRVTLGNKMWSEKIVEIQPVGTDSGIIVWQWRAWDHLVQDVDSTKPNYGVVAEHPELLDINLGTLSGSQSDWLHFNGLDYNEELDQLMVSCHNLNEFYIIDHSTTMEEAASHAGGNSGKGGDLLYRWGNPQNYDRGTSDDRKLFQQHHAHWISQDGDVMLFNNGVGRPGTDYTSVDVLKLPAMVDNNYPIEPDSAYLPLAQDWIYSADPPNSLFSLVMGGAQRLPNGNTLICNATSGEFLEVDSLGNDMWKYVNPIDLNGNTPQGDQPFQNSCFRVTYLPPGYPGFNGQVLVPGEPLELNPDNYVCPTIATPVAEVWPDSYQNLLYPNPIDDHFMVRAPIALKAATLQVHDLTGRLLFEQENIQAVPQSALSFYVTLPEGMVVVSLQDASQHFTWNASAVVQ